MNNHAIVKEAIPEFYGTDEGFLVNSMKLDLGVRQNGKRVNVIKSFNSVFKLFDRMSNFQNGPRILEIT